MLDESQYCIHFDVWPDMLNRMTSVQRATASARSCSLLSSHVLFTTICRGGAAKFLDPKKAEIVFWQIRKVLNSDMGQRDGGWSRGDHEIHNLIAKWLETIRAGATWRVESRSELKNIIWMAACWDLKILEHVRPTSKSCDSLVQVELLSFSVPSMSQRRLRCVR